MAAGVRLVKHSAVSHSMVGSGHHGTILALKCCSTSTSAAHLVLAFLVLFGAALVLVVRGALVVPALTKNP